MNNEPFLKKVSRTEHTLHTDSEHAKKSGSQVNIAKLQAAVFGWCCISLVVGIAVCALVHSYLAMVAVTATGIFVSFYFYRASMAGLKTVPTDKTVK